MITSSNSEVSMSSSTDFSFSSSSSEDFFNVFPLREEGFYSLSLPFLSRIDEEDRIPGFSYKNSLSRECVWGISFCYFVPHELEIIDPRKGDSVFHPHVGFSAIYVDHFKVGLHLPIFPYSSTS